MPTLTELHDERNEKGRFVAKADGSTKLERRTRTSKQQLQRRLLTDLEQHGQAAIEKFRERDPGAYLRFATEYLGIASSKGRNSSGSGITIVIKQYADPDDSTTTGVTIEATAEHDDVPDVAEVEDVPTLILE